MATQTGETTIYATQSSNDGPSFGPCWHSIVAGKTTYRGYDLDAAIRSHERHGGRQVPAARRQQLWDEAKELHHGGG